MPDFVNRPSFFEGQFVSAADLNLSVQYGRDADARHLRLQHTWGIVAGLGLSQEDRNINVNGVDTPFVEVTLASGVFVDGTGRATVVTEDTRVPEVQFRDSGVTLGQADATYPVFVVGRDQTVQNNAGLTSGCQTQAPSRVNEIFEIEFGRMSDLEDLDSQITVDVTDGPGGSSGGSWRVLVGFVRWNDSIERFTAALPQADGISPRYAGVRAAEVVSPGGTLMLRSSDVSAQGGRALAITSGDEGSLEFGPQDPGGAVKPVLMKVDKDGNLTVSGKIIGALAGGVQVESGVATDGMLLPLPTGITQEQVDDGEVAVQAHVSPRIQQPDGLDPAQKWFPHFYECFLEDRRVRCRVRWIQTIGGSSFRDFAGVCDYVLMAFPSEPGGA